MDIKEAMREMKSLSPSESAIETVLNELDKKDKIINEMAGNIFLMNGDRGCTKQEKIDYFTKKVEGK